MRKYHGHTLLYLHETIALGSGSSGLFTEMFVDTYQPMMEDLGARLFGLWAVHPAGSGAATSLLWDEALGRRTDQLAQGRSVGQVIHRREGCRPARPWTTPAIPPAAGPSATARRTAECHVPVPPIRGSCRSADRPSATKPQRRQADLGIRRRQADSDGTAAGGGQVDSGLQRGRMTHRLDDDGRPWTPFSMAACVACRSGVRRNAKQSLASRVAGRPRPREHRRGPMRSAPPPCRHRLDPRRPPSGRGGLPTVLSTAPPPVSNRAAEQRRDGGRDVVWHWNDTVACTTAWVAKPDTPKWCGRSQSLPAQPHSAAKVPALFAALPGSHGVSPLVATPRSAHTRRQERHHDALAYGHVGHAVANLLDDSGCLMPEQHRRRPHLVAVHHRQVEWYTPHGPRCAPAVPRGRVGPVQSR